DHADRPAQLSGHLRQSAWALKDIADAMPDAAGAQFPDGSGDGRRIQLRLIEEIIINDKIGDSGDSGVPGAQAIEDGIGPGAAPGEVGVMIADAMNAED